jgi:hypothetical protein
MSLQEALYEIELLLSFNFLTEEDKRAVEAIKNVLETQIQGVDRRYKELYLAYYMGILVCDEEEIESIPDMTEDELDRALSTKGELIGWDSWGNQV